MKIHNAIDLSNFLGGDDEAADQIIMIYQILKAEGCPMTLHQVVSCLLLSGGCEWWKEREQRLAEQELKEGARVH
jgi:hypothetical protein